MKIKKVKAYWQLMRVDKPGGYLLLFWPTIWALILSAKGKPDLSILAVFTSGTFLMRSAGCAINDFADRKIDKFVKRTKDRPLPSGAVSSKEAVALFIFLSTLSFLLVFLTVNRLTTKLSFVGLVLASIYPFTKRYTHLPQLFLALAFSWSVPMAWAAQSGYLPGDIWVIFLLNALWVVAYDTQYAMADRDDDLKIGVGSVAILLGRFGKLVIGILQSFTVMLLIWTGLLYKQKLMYFVCVLISSCLFFYQHHLMRDRKNDHFIRAFSINNYVGMVITLGLESTYI